MGEKNIEWLREKYGSQNVVHAALHMDETSPHIVAYVVPEVDGKLNARALFGGRKVLSDLQSSYAEAMSQFGLERGIEGSKAKHQTLKNFYAGVNSIEKLAVQELRKIAEPVSYPEPTLISVFSKQHRDSEKQDWLKRDRSQKANLVKTAGKAVSSTKSLHEQVKSLKAENSMLTAENDGLKHRLLIAYEELALPKDEINKLRKLDISAVAAHLGYFGAVSKNENAIDLVKRIQGFDYQQSVAWLHAEFGAAGAAQAVEIS